MVKTALITGATGAIGKAIAQKTASFSGWKVVLAARNEKKAEKTVERIIRNTGNRNVHFVIADLSREQEIVKLAENWNGPLNVLVNNAAVTPKRREENSEGTELQWAVNVLAYWRMIESFTPVLSETAKTEKKFSRIVNVASYWAGGLDLSDVEFKKRPYDNNSAYRQSKQSDRMLSFYFSKLLNSKKINVNACHPGEVRSSLASNLGFGGHESAEYGADTPVWLALSNDCTELNGKWVEYRKITTDRFVDDWDYIEKFTELIKNYTN